MTWDDVASMLNDLDEWGGLNTDYFYSNNNEICDFVHGYLDNYDMTGDPVFEWVTDPMTGTRAYAQIDDCDGQPNFC